ncbi:hypothetical protein THASP1DRAFT_30303 [Thamnocephalis sphaerospora]|uniref:SCP domain-containing protein n=1 Tax=Thamnocephalis sphaerospora TaxID=78915 RepID=A0A4P9XQV6_9FUNG|nr:hypothetical protein THASP1DRAFT_30303 [Thamnocephalis sphaerospora]|eukprot:RKP07891.1 hypothetical protein THASP1DRAFT_30303 [Thamnocephalis sphaerospora]
MKIAVLATLLLAAFQYADAYTVEEMVCAVNKERAAAGKAPLGIDPRLVSAAQSHSQAQANARSMSHQLSGEPSPSQRVTNAGYKWTSTAENVAYGYPDLDSVMKGWMNSAGHRANILGNYANFGSGAASGGGTMYHTQVFASGEQSGSYPSCPSGNSTASPSPAPEPAPSPSTYSSAPEPASSPSSYSSAPAPSPYSSAPAPSPSHSPAPAPSYSHRYGSKYGQRRYTRVRTYSAPVSAPASGSDHTYQPTSAPIADAESGDTYEPAAPAGNTESTDTSRSMEPAQNTGFTGAYGTAAAPSNDS